MRTELLRFNGALERDPASLLQGTGKFMRHVKLRPGNRHKHRSAKHAHRYGVLGYKGARRKPLAEKSLNYRIADHTGTCSGIDRHKRFAGADRTDVCRTKYP